MANPKTAFQLQDAVIDFLAMYQSTPHTFTNSLPSEQLNNRHLRTVLDLLHSCQTDFFKNKKRQNLNYDCHSQFAVGNVAWARNFRQGPRWHCATVTECLGNVMFKAQLEDERVVTWRTHANQLCIRITPVNVDTANNADSNSNDARFVSNHPLLPRRSS